MRGHAHLTDSYAKWVIMVITPDNISDPNPDGVTCYKIMAMIVEKTVSRGLKPDGAT